MKQILIIYVILINLLGFFLMGIDKQKARRRKWRISERTLFLVALLFGSIGIFTGMQLFRHKTRHLTFVLGIPVILMIQLLLCCGLFSWNARRMNSPSQAVEHELSLIRELDSDTIASFVSYKNLTSSNLASGSIDEDVSDAVVLFFRNFRYNILNEEIDADQATVSVNITNLDMHALAQDLCRAIYRQTASLTEEAPSFTTSDYYRLLYRTLSDNHYDTLVTTAHFHLKHDAEGWIILSDSTLEDELVSGFISYINDPYILTASELLSIQMDALKELDGDGWKAYLKINDVFSTYNTDYAPLIDDAYAQQLARFCDYTILKCSEKGNTATAAMRITCMDLSAILSRYKHALLEYASTTRPVRDNDVQVSNETFRLLLDALNENTASATTDVELTFYNNGKTWEINFSDELSDALTGNIGAAIEAFRSVSAESKKAG